jgi:DNA-binding NarL/FixJ family response regulator
VQQPLKKFAKARPHRIDPLTTRERQIVRVMAEGLTNKEIAQRLRLAEGTVKVHLHRIYQKLGIANRTALPILAHTNFAKHVH